MEMEQEVREAKVREEEAESYGSELLRKAEKRKEGIKVRFEKAEKKWAKETFKGCDYGDLRLRKRMINYAADQASDPEGATAAVCEGSSAKERGAYRLLHHEAVSAEATLTGISATTWEEAQRHEIVLLIQDTSNMEIERKSTKPLKHGEVRKTKKIHTEKVHTTFAVEGHQGIVIGIMHQHSWPAKPPADKEGKVVDNEGNFIDKEGKAADNEGNSTDKEGKAADNEANSTDKEGKAPSKQAKAAPKPYTERESYKWQYAAESLAPILGEKKKNTIIIGDAESDVYEFIEYNLQHGQPFLIRAAQDRNLSEPEGKLKSVLASLPVLGTYQVEIPQSGKRPHRIATVEVRAKWICLAGKSNQHRERNALPLQGILLTETAESAAAAQQLGTPPLEWLLLSSERAVNFTQLGILIRWYSYRWKIEEFHKVWKSGCRCEQRKLKWDALQRLLPVLAVIACRILQLRDLSRTSPTLLCTEFFSPLEWRCLYWYVHREQPQTPLPETPPTIQWCFENIAHLGGWRDTKKNGKIGWQTLWKGWRRFAVLVDGFSLAVAMLSSQLLSTIPASLQSLIPTATL
jgi:hypothetical protein